MTYLERVAALGSSLTWCKTTIWYREWVNEGQPRFGRYRTWRTCERMPTVCELATKRQLCWQHARKRGIE